MTDSVIREIMEESIESGGPPVEGKVPEAWHSLPLVELMSRLESTPEGLSEREAAQRLERFGRNSLQAPRQVSAWKILIDQFRSVVVLLLVAASLVAWTFGDPVEALAVLAVLVINTALGFTSEMRARSAMAALFKLEVPHAVVVREGRAREIEAHDLVPGDVVIIEAGEAVPADGRLISATELRTNEGALTGESFPLDKKADVTLRADTPLAERVNSVFMSTAVVAGSGRAVVVATGMNTQVGLIGGLVGGIEDERTPLENRLDDLGRRLVWLTLGIAGIVISVGIYRGEQVGLMIETGIALAIAAVPEGLPAVATIALAVGVARMARRNALVRRLPAVEALGSATTVCTDKTGTLTAGEMTVTMIWAGGREYTISGTGYAPEGEFQLNGEIVHAREVPALELALRIGALSNRAAIHQEEDQWTIRGDPTEAALLVAARKAGIDLDELAEQWPEIAEVPFSSERMMMATFHRRNDGDVAYVKGAPARILERSDRMLDVDGEVPLDDGARKKVLEQNRNMAARGLRVLALATGDAEQVDEEGVPTNLILTGLVGFSDPPAEGVRETIARFREAGIHTLMITGDQRITAEVIARNLGILDEDEEVMEGRDLQKLSSEELTRRISRISALSRVSPEDKFRVVEALQSRGEVVAMLGDGVNDAAALKKADIGVAMGMRGTDVAKEAASVVLQDDRFMTIGVAVEEGRVIFDNIRKFVFYLFSCNVAEVLIILVAVLIGLPPPLLPLQILWLNLVTDTFPALSLAMEPGDDDVMRRPPYDPREAILSPRFMGRTVAYALVITVVTLGAFHWALGNPEIGRERAMTFAFMTLALAQTFHLATARSDEPLLSWRQAASNRWALIAVAVTIALQLLAVYLEPLADLLGVTPLTVDDWFVIVPLALVPAVIGQAAALIRRALRGPQRVAA